MNPLSEDLMSAICNGEFERTKTLTHQSLHSGLDGYQIASEIVAPAMNQAILHVSEGIFFIPELVLATKAAQDCLKICEASFPRSRNRMRMVVVFGAVIGKNILVMILESAGCRVIDLGVDVAPRDLVKAGYKTTAPIVELSALLDTTMAQTMVTIIEFEKAGLKSQVIIGDRPATAIFAKGIDAMDTLQTRLIP